jgi:protein TonB
LVDVKKFFTLAVLLISLNVHGQSASTDADPVLVPWIGNLSIIYQPDADAYYPSFSKRAGESGKVTLILSINELGDVTSAAVSQSSGIDRLDKAALEMGKRYKFKPYEVNGKPRKVVTNLYVIFNHKPSN